MKNPVKLRVFPRYLSLRSVKRGLFDTFSKSQFDIMGVGPEEINTRGDALIENEKTGYRSREQLLGCGQGLARSRKELSPCCWETCARRGSSISLRGNGSRLGADHDRRCGRNNLVPQDRSKEIATPPEVATYKNHTKPLPRV